jgi:ADP-ribosylation factor related protein 1
MGGVWWALISSTIKVANGGADEVLTSPRLLNLPLLLLANKQDSPTSLSVAEIRESFDAWQRSLPSRPPPPAVDGTSGMRRGDASPDLQWDDGGAKDERMASLDVMGVSALEG